MFFSQHDVERGAAAIKAITHVNVTTIMDGETMARAVLEAVEERRTCWLIEWPISDNLPARWWHPGGGWMIDANKAIRFARKVDADDQITNGRFVGGVIPTEHKWIDAPILPPEQAA